MPRGNRRIATTAIENTTICAATGVAIVALGAGSAWQLTNDQSLDLPALGEASFAAIDTHAGDTPQSDDITLMLIKVPATIVDQQQRCITLSAGPDCIRLALSWLEDLLATHEELAETQGVMMLAAEEVLTNILKYGELPVDAEVEVCLDISASEVQLRIRDPGVAFDPLTQAQQAELGLDVESAAVGGLGVHLFKSLTDRQEYRRENGCNILLLCKSRK